MNVTYQQMSACCVDATYNFEAEVKSVLQDFLQAEHSANLLMPTINGHFPQLTESQLRHYT